MSGSVETIRVAVSAEVFAELQSAVAAGQYDSTDEAINQALSEWLFQHRRGLDVQALREAWEQARQDNSPGVPPDGVFDRLRDKYEALARGERPGAKNLAA